MRLIITLLLVFAIHPVWAQRERTITFKSGENTLAGTLTFPQSAGVYPGVLITLGSGSRNRDGEVDGLKPFKLVAAALAKNGFVVLRYDNRSTGLSSGKPIEQSTTEDLATDAQAAFDHLRNQKGVDRRRIGFIGHSEGATIAAITVSKNPQASFLLTINGSPLTGFDDIRLATEQRLRKAGKSTDSIQSYLKNLSHYLGRPPSVSLEERRKAARNIIMYEIRQLPASEQAGITKQEIDAAVNSQMREVLTRWQERYLALNPAVYYPAVHCPVRLFFSDTELEGILSKRAAQFRKILGDGTHDYSIRIIRNADHNLINAKPATARRVRAVSSEFVRSIARQAKELVKTAAH